MTLKRFNQEIDMTPIPIDSHICSKALYMKNLGLKWQPHVGCFVWDPDGFIKQASPFPERVYFILSIPRFIDIFGDMKNIAEKLVWIPTWHQARLLCLDLGVPNEAVASIWRSNANLSPAEELRRLYELLIDSLQKQNTTTLNKTESALDNLCSSVMKDQIGNISKLPEELAAAVKRVYQDFTQAYLNVLRQKENKPRDWFPNTMSIDWDLANDMRHFFSDYQHITKRFFVLNQKIDQLRQIDKANQPNLYQERIDHLLERFGQSSD